MKSFFYTIVTLLLLNTAANAQVKVGTAGAADPSATLEITGGPDGNKGLLLPRLTTVQRDAIALPATGLVIYNTTASLLQVNSGTPAAPIWSIPTSNNAWGTSGNGGTNAASNFIGTTDAQPLILKSNNVEGLRVTPGGNVGLGGADPTGQLQLNNALSARKLVLWDGAANNINRFFGLGVENLMLRYQVNNTGDDHVFFSGTTDDASQELLRIKGNGNVGIGTSAPPSRLAVSGNLLPFGGLSIENTSVANATAVTITPGFDLNTPALSATTFDMPGTGAFVFADNVIPYGAMQLGVPERRWASVSTQNLDVNGIGRIAGSVPANTMTSITGRDATGNVGNVTLGAGLTFADGTISATAAGSGTNIYHSDGTVTGPRTVTLGANPLTFNGTGIINLNSGAVGIGTATPGGRLTVSGPFTPYAGVTVQNTNPDIATIMTVTPGYDMGAAVANITTFDMDGTGSFTFGDNVIGAIGMQLGLPERRWIAVNAVNVDAVDVNASNTVRAAGVVLTSDSRLKKNVINVTNGLKSVMALRPVSYDKKKSLKDSDYSRHEMGFIAQEVAKVLPNVVSEGAGSDKILGVSYTELIPVLTRALQEQQALIQEQGKQIAALKEQQTSLAQLVEKMKQMEQMMLTKGTSASAKVAAK